MPFSYGDQPNSSGSVSQQRDAVRFLAQDHVAGAMRVSDAEIAFALSEEANVYLAAARVVDTIVLKLSQTTRKRVGNTEIERSLEHYEKLSASLRTRGLSHQVPYVGGLSKTEKDVDRANEDRVAPYFRRDMNDSPGSTMPPTSGVDDDPR